MFNLLIIDPQNDFCDPKGSLQVPGAEGDMMVLARFIRSHKNEIKSITVTLDQHKPLQIFHPLFWLGENGGPAMPFSSITSADVKKGVWTPINAVDEKRTLQYLEILESRNKPPLMIWPYHCLIGTWGSNVYEYLSIALTDWSKYRYQNIDWVLKGSDVYSEQYSALRPENIVSTNSLSLFDPTEPLYVAGEAFDFCVANTVRDIIGAETNITILEDCTSSINKENAKVIKEEFASKGVKFAKASDL